MADSLTRRAEVISIGDELTSGQRLDTNSQWLSQQLAELGIQTMRHTTVADDLQSCVDAFRLAAQRADLVLCSGGLGPTLDDLTRQAMADAFHAPLELDVDSLEKIQQMFAQRQRPMPENNRLQAMFPHGSRIIPNPHGSAPGIDLSVGTPQHSSRIFALPGVPAELKQMWSESVAPRIEEMLCDGDDHVPERWRYRAIKLFGIGESDVEVKLPTLIERNRVPTVGITVSRATITLRIAARTTSDEHFDELIAPTLQEIQRELGDLIFGDQEDELEHVVLRLLEQQQLTLASAEIGAANWISEWMLKGADDAFGGYVGGLAFPTLAGAQRWLAGTGLDDSSVWEQLARLCQDRFETDVVLVIGGYPSQSEMARALQPFSFHYGLMIGDDYHYQQRNMAGHPDVLGPRAAKFGLDWLRRVLTQHSPA